MDGFDFVKTLGAGRGAKLASCSSIMFCGRCGADNPTDNRFCFDCGARLMWSGTEGDPITDEVSVRLVGLGGLPESIIEWPEDLERELTGVDGVRFFLVPFGFF